MSRNTVGHPVPKGYSNGCRCRDCLDAWAAHQRRYRADAKVKADQMKLELEQLRAWRDQMLASAPSGSAQ